MRMTLIKIAYWIGFINGSRRTRRALHILRRWY